MPDHPGKENAVLVSLDFDDSESRESLEELRQLAETARLNVAHTVQGRRIRPDAATFAGSGIITRYYNPEIHIGAFALPQYVLQAVNKPSND